MEFYSIEVEWGHRSSPPENIEFPESIGQRVEISTGVFRGSRGYVEGWDTSISKTTPHVIVNLYFKATSQCPTLDSQSHNPIASLGKIRVLPNVIQRLASYKALLTTPEGHSTHMQGMFYKNINNTLSRLWVNS